MNILALNQYRFDTRVLLAREVFLNVFGTTHAVRVSRVGENNIYPVFVARDVESGEVILEWSSIQMRPSDIFSTWFNIEVFQPYYTFAELVVPDFERDVEEEDDDE